MLTARAITRSAKSREIADSNAVRSFDQRLMGETSVGLNAVAVLKDSVR